MSRLPVRATGYRPTLLVMLAASLAVEPATAGAMGIPPARPEVVITGAAVIPASRLNAFIGRAPRPERRWARWARKSRSKLVRYYRSKGYRLARGWYYVDFQRRKIKLHVDEGRISRIDVRGGGLVARLRARAEIALPHGVYHRKTVRNAMKRLRELPSLQYAYVRVVQTGELVTTPLGNLAAKRALRVLAVAREPAGLHAVAELHPRFGLNIQTGYAHSELAAKRDRVEAQLSVALPVRKYYDETGPSARWVAGGASVGYRIHPDAESDLALGLSTEVHVTRDSRRDAGWANLLDLLWRADVALVHIGKGPFIATTGLGAEFRNTLTRRPDADKVQASAFSHRWQLQWRTRLELDVRPTILRLDDANRLWLEGDLSVTPAGEVSGRMELGGKGVYNLGSHQLRGEFGGFTTLGTERFQDMVAVAGGIQRTFFGAKWWTHRMARLEIAYRGRLSPSLQLGVSHTLTVFENRDSGTAQATLINAAGPSAHLTFLDFLALDVGYYVGFVLWPRTKLQWSHNLNVRVSTVF